MACRTTDILKSARKPFETKTQLMPIVLRPVEAADIPAMASIRARNSFTHAYWHDRISRYLSGEHSPQQALADRTAFVAVDAGQIIGFVAGHTTKRFQCDAELEWIDTIEERRRQGIAGSLIATMAVWFAQHNAMRVCVDPGNSIARSLYAKYGAHSLNQHWMVWDDVSQIRPYHPPKNPNNPTTSER
jgi:ribosomal protein S18 acetylase RimI-like enzyme